MSDQSTIETPTALDPRATGRDWLAAGLLWLPVLTIAATATLWTGRLPESLPTQWNAAAVTSTSPTYALLAITGGVALLGALAGLVVLASRAADYRRTALLAAGFFAGLSAGVWLVSAGLVVATGTPEPAAGAWPLLGVLCGAFGLIPFALSPRRPIGRELRSPTPMLLAEGETGAWFSTITVPVFFWLAGILTLAAVGVAALGVTLGGAGAEGAGTLILVAVLFLAFARLRVTVDRRGLRVTSGLLRVPLRRVPLDQIVSARAETIRPLEWGGWGYRVLPGRSAILVTGGPGIVVERTNGTLFAVTVADPELPAALLTALAAR